MACYLVHSRLDLLGLHQKILSRIMTSMQNQDHKTCHSYANKTCYNFRHVFHFTYYMLGIHKNQYCRDSHYPALTSVQQHFAMSAPPLVNPPGNEMSSTPPPNPQDDTNSPMDLGAEVEQTSNFCTWRPSI